MKYQTTIDTVGLQIDLTHENDRNTMLEEILRLLRVEKLHIVHKDYPINQHSNFYVREHHVYAYNLVIARISTGSYSVKDALTNTVITTYYTAIEFAGLKRYNEQLDNLSNMMLLKLCAYLNTRHITFKITGLDVAIDLYTKYENVLALCTKKSPKTIYHTANELQWYDTTRYIENIPKHKQPLAVQRAYLYDKTIKDEIPYPLTRFEVKLQPKFFNKNRTNIILGIMNALDRYHVMYVPNKREKSYLMDQYDAHTTLRQRDIKKLKMDNYRCYLDISVVTGFINRMYSVQEEEMTLLRST